MSDVGERCVGCGGAAADSLFNKNGYDIVRCKECSLVYVGNPPTPEQLKELYSFESGYHEKVTTRGEAQAGFLSRAADQYAFVKSLGSAKGKVLDVGCSVGFFLACAQRDGWDVAGVEFSPDTAEYARKQLGDHVFTGVLEAAPFEIGAFDLITMWDVLEHVRDPMAMLARAGELLGADGKLVLETPNVDGWFPRASLLVAKSLDYWPHPEPPGHLFQFSVVTLCSFLQRTGFEILEIRHKRIPIRYSFGEFSSVFSSLKRLAYFALFAPLAYVGPWFGAGDSMIVVARKKA